MKVLYLQKIILFVDHFQLIMYGTLYCILNIVIPKIPNQHKTNVPNLNTAQFFDKFHQKTLKSSDQQKLLMPDSVCMHACMHTYVMELAKINNRKSKY